MPDASLVVQELIYGVLLGCVFAAIAHGLNVIWGVTKIVNIAHGEFIMLGAYGAYFLNVALGFNPLMSAPVDAAIGLGAGLGFYYGFLHRELRGKERITLQSEMVTLVATFGLSLAVSNAAVLVFSGNHVGFTWNVGTLVLGPYKVPDNDLIVAAVGVTVIALTDLFFRRTYLGRAIQAYSQDIPAAQLMGIDPEKVAAIATSLGFAITMLGGALLTIFVSVGIDPYMGQTYAPICFVIVVLGGPGKMWGSLAGGLVLGIVIDVIPAFFNSAVAYAVAFLLLIPVLLFAPEGIVR